MALDIFLRAVPATGDATPDVRVYDPTQADPAAPGGTVPLRTMMGLGL